MSIADMLNLVLDERSVASVKDVRVASLICEILRESKTFENVLDFRVFGPADKNYEVLACQVIGGTSVSDYSGLLNKAQAMAKAVVLTVHTEKR